MKKLLLALAVCCFLFACDKNEKQPEEPAEAPELTLTSESVVNVPADGDEVTITYTLANPAENGDISAKAADGAEWCDGFDCDTDGQVTFTVAANDGDARETVVTVTYIYGEGEHKDIQVTVKQVALGEPLFELTSDSEISVSRDGEDVTVTYSITDPREDGQVSVNVPDGVDWISNVNTDTDGQVAFTVAANDGDARETELTFVYTYGGSETQEFVVNVSQEGLPDPVLTLTSESEVEVSGNGGNFTISYTLENPREDGGISVSSGEATWLDFNTDTDGEIAVEVFANGESTARSAVVTVTYTYSGDKTVSFEVTVNQDRHYDYELNATIISGQYFGDDYSNVAGEMIYALFFQDTEDYWVSGHNYYYLGLKAGEPSDMNAIAPPVGTYTALMSDGYDADGEFKIMKNGSGPYMTCGYVNGATRKGMIAGEITVSYDGTNYTIEGTLTSTDQAVHHISYTGPISLQDARTEPEPEPDVISLLTEDVTIDWPNAKLLGSIGGVYWSDESRYSLTIGAGTYNIGDQNIQLSIYSSETPEVTDGLPLGTFQIDDSGAEGTVEAGSLTESTFGGLTIAGSWLYPYGGSYSDYAAPLMSGELTVTKNENGGFDCVLEAMDDAGNNINATFHLDITSFNIITI